MPESCGPGQASGWNCTVKIFFPTYDIPSFVPSLTFTNAGYCNAFRSSAISVYHISMVLGRNINSSCLPDPLPDGFHLCVRISSCSVYTACWQVPSADVPGRLQRSAHLLNRISFCISFNNGTAHSAGSPGPFDSMIPCRILSPSDLFSRLCVPGKR